MNIQNFIRENAKKEQTKEEFLKSIENSFARYTNGDLQFARNLWDTVHLTAEQKKQRDEKIYKDGKDAAKFFAGLKKMYRKAKKNSRERFN